MSGKAAASGLCLFPPSMEQAPLLLLLPTQHPGVRAQGHLGHCLLPLQGLIPSVSPACEMLSGRKVCVASPVSDPALIHFIFPYPFKLTMTTLPDMLKML